MRIPLEGINRWMIIDIDAPYQRQSNQPVVGPELHFRHPPGDDAHYDGDCGNYRQYGYGCHNLRPTVFVEPWYRFSADALSR